MAAKQDDLVRLLPTSSKQPATQEPGKKGAPTSSKQPTTQEPGSKGAPTSSKQPATQEPGKKGADSRTCFNCKESGHIAKQCPLKRTCYSCGKPGHFKQDCPDLHCKKDAQEGPPIATSFIDTHCHIEYVFERASHMGTFQSFTSRFQYPDSFEACISTFCDPAAFSSFGIWSTLLEEDKVYGTFGIHPHHAKHYNDELEAKVLTALSHPKCVAYGEFGLDYSAHSSSSPDVQKEVFRRQIQLAIAYEKPLVIHSRGADKDLAEILLSSGIPPETGIHLHCCSSSPQVVKDLMTAFENLYVGVTASVFHGTTKHTAQHHAQHVPLHRLLLETDSPYLCPPNMKQKWNHPAKIVDIGARVAALRKLPLQDVLQQTTLNARRLYMIGDYPK